MSLITWNPNDKGSGVVLSNNDMTARTPNQLNSVRATEAKTSGKWYWELDMNNISHIFIGVASKLASMSINLTYNPYIRGYYNGNGKKFPEEANYGQAFQTKDVIGIALDLDSFTLEFYRNGESQGISHTNLEVLGEVFPLFTSGSSSTGGTITANFGATPFKYPVPAGYLPYDVDNADWLNPNKYLLKQDSKILTIESDTLVETMLQEPLTRVDFEELGFNNLNLLLDKDLSSVTLLINPPDKTTVSTVSVNAVPKPQMILPIKDIYLRMLNDIQSFTVTPIGDVTGIIRLIFSVNSGASWQTLDSTTGQFKTISNIEDLNEVKAEGMTIETFNSIGAKWSEVIKGMSVRFGYYLEIEEMNDIANVDKLEVIMDVLGNWEALMHEIDYDYEYDNEKIYIKLYRNGSYKINYI